MPRVSAFYGHRFVSPLRQGLTALAAAGGRPGSSSAATDRRQMEDRRQKPTNPFRLDAARGRRLTIRREKERLHRPYTDRYSRTTFLAAVLVILACVADALYTLLHLGRGAVELNPLMRGLIALDPYVFLELKLLLSACGVVLLVLYSQHVWSRRGLAAVAAGYCLLIAYQVWLFVQ